MKTTVEDFKCYDNDYSPTITKDTSASNIGIEYDKRYYTDDELFENLINDIQKMTLS